MSTPNQSKPNGIWATRIKSLTLLITALAGLGAGLSAHLFPKKEKLAQTTYVELQTQIIQLQTWARAAQLKNRTTLDACKAETQSIRTYITGYLMGLARQLESKDVQQVSKSLSLLLKPKDAPKMAKPTTSLKALQKPKSLKALIQQAY